MIKYSIIFLLALLLPGPGECDITQATMTQINPMTIAVGIVWNVQADVGNVLTDADIRIACFYGDDEEPFHVQGYDYSRGVARKTSYETVTGVLVPSWTTRIEVYLTGKDNGGDLEPDLEGFDL